jgi:hypothetical protein
MERNNRSRSKTRGGRGAAFYDPALLHNNQDEVAPLPSGHPQRPLSSHSDAAVFDMKLFRRHGSMNGQCERDYLQRCYFSSNF